MRYCVLHMQYFCQEKIIVTKVKEKIRDEKTGRKRKRPGRIVNDEARQKGRGHY